MTGTQALANAIIIQATKDYRHAIQALKRNPRNQAAMAEAMEIEMFFHSSWYKVLTDLDPNYLLNRLRKEAA